MRAPRTWFSTELRPGRRLLRARLGDLFAPPRRRGRWPLLAAVALTACLGPLVSCQEAAPEEERLLLDQDALAVSALEAAELLRPDDAGTWTYLLALQGPIGVEGAPVDFPAGEDLGCVLSYDAGVHAGGYGDLLFFQVDGETGALKGEPILLYGDENDLRWWTEEDGPHVLYAAVTTYQGLESCQAGEVLWDGEGWRWLWPAPPDSQDYRDFWTDRKGVLTPEGLDLYVRGDWAPGPEHGAEPQWTFAEALPFGEGAGA